MNEIKIITEEILDKTALILTESYADYKKLTAFLADLDSINTFGYFTTKGKNGYVVLYMLTQLYKRQE